MTDTNTLSSQKPIVVGIGASAGGLEALSSFAKNIVHSENIAYIIAQHLSPTYKSMLVELISRETKEIVVEAQDGALVVGGKIYITPQNCNIVVKNGKISLEDPKNSGYLSKPSIDYFLISLANEYRERAIGVLLSGTGSDGSVGSAMIKEQGGVTIAQDPISAKYDSMPLSAINSNVIDLVLDCSEIGKEIIEISTQIEQNSQFLSKKSDLSEFERIIEIISQKKGINFANYKQTTLKRRIQRRMTTLKISSLCDYKRVLQSSDDEINRAFKDMLIGVTEFFRDRMSFDRLKDELKRVVSKKSDGDILRIWDVGCSSGEETYSLIITLFEVISELNIGELFSIQVFATDIDEDALKVARSGIYSPSMLKDVDKEIISKYFTQRGEMYEVVKRVRDVVIFSRHNVLEDPPFLRLDLISCRNLLIYFNTFLQNRVLPIFHFSLNENGILFLGSSESLGESENYYKSLSKKDKIFQKELVSKEQRKGIFQSYKLKRTFEQKEQNKEPTFEDILRENIGKNYLAKSVIINENDDIIYSRENLDFLRIAQGDASFNIYKCLDGDVSLELRKVIFDSKKTNATATSDFFKIAKENDKIFRLIVIPIECDFKSSRLFIVAFEEHSVDEFLSFGSYIDRESSKDYEVIEIELKKTKSHLQTVIEELETSNEELQSTNEELQSSNEELQSTNEELETTNEELQSTNEELQTAYAELKIVDEEREEQRKIALNSLEEIKILNSALEEKSNFIEGILDASLSGIVALSPIFDDGELVDFEIVKSNPKACELFGVANMESYTFNHFLSSFLDYDVLFLEFKSAIKNRASINRDYEFIKNNRTYFYHCNAKNHNSGLLLSLYDITESIEAHKREKMYQDSRREMTLELLANISHQWRQPLNVISMGIQIADGDIDNGDLEDAKKHNQVVLKETKYLSEVINKFKRFYTFGSKKEKVNLKKEIEKILELMEPVLSAARIDVVLEISSEIKISALLSTITDIFVVFINNTIDISRKRELERAKIIIVATKSEEFLTIETIDNCGGIEDVILEKIFDPYTTTKFKDRGKGLSMFTVKNLVEFELKGEVMAENWQDGAKFTIRIPNEY